MSKKKADIPWFNAFTHQILLRPLTLESECAGAVNLLAGYTAGAMEIAVDAFTETETDDIMDALDNKQPLYLVFGAPGVQGTAAARQVYKIIHATESATLLNKIWIFPSLKEATLADDAVITVIGENSDGWDEYLDLGTIGDAGPSVTLDVESKKILDEVGATYRAKIKVKGGSLNIPLLDMTKENFLLFSPNTNVIGNDTDDSEAFVISSGDYDSATWYLKAVPRDDYSDASRTIVFAECVQVFDGVELKFGGAEGTDSLPIKFDAGGSEIIRIGTETATYVHV